MKISIITITFNAERFLSGTVHSIMEQTCTDIEYIIVDGKSTDRTVDIIRECEENFRAKGIEFKWISEPDKGLYDAMNKGLQMATGDFVWFINAGDKLFDNTTVRQVVDAMTDNPDVIYGQTLIIDSNDNSYGKRHKIAPNNLKFKHMINGLVVCHQSIVVRREIAPAYDLNYRYSADYDWVCKVLKMSRSNCYINGYISRFMLSGISAKNRKASWIERFQIMLRHFGLIRTLAAHLVFVLKYPFSKQLK